jgi:hypothetical protein
MKRRSGSLLRTPLLPDVEAYIEVLPIVPRLRWPWRRKPRTQRTKPHIRIPSVEGALRPPPPPPPGPPTPPRPPDHRPVS